MRARKIIDFLTEEADLHVVAVKAKQCSGHTVIIGGKKFTLHLIPSGILRTGKACVIGNGVVVDPIDLIRELTGLRKQGVTITDNLFISDCAHVVFPYHRMLDECRERAKGDKKIGTTKRGIGPCYGDKVERTGLRMGDLVHPKTFSEKLQAKIEESNKILEAFGEKPIDFLEVKKAYLSAARKLAPYITNTVVYLHEAIKAGRNILFEGAQGTFLDLDHGTYPYVTSSNTTAGGACTGTGVPPHRIDRVIGVMKAYTTRVGEGPFPTENQEISDMLHAMGREFGSTTGRPRRCGWFDSVATRYSSMINGIDELAVTNLDGLDHVENIKICVAYKLGTKTLSVPPSNLRELKRCVPVLIELPGWKASTAQARTFRELPSKARNYLKKIASLTGPKLSIVSVGADREQTIRP